MYQVHLRKAESAGKKAEEKAAKRRPTLRRGTKIWLRRKKLFLKRIKVCPPLKSVKFEMQSLSEIKELKLMGGFTDSDVRVKILCLLNYAMVPDFCKLF